jgi:hypothetical protein
MFSFDIFAEIMVVGALLLLALAPIFVRLSTWAEQKPGFVPLVDYLKEGSGRFVLVLLVAYALGVAGNRLIDDAVDAVGIDPGSVYKERYRAMQDKPNRPKELKIAEFWLRERNEATAGWLDRHKSYVRITRGSMFACLLLLLTMTIYRLSRPSKPRYGLIQYGTTMLLLVVFASAFVLEAESYKKRVFELALELPDSAK